MYIIPIGKVVAWMRHQCGDVGEDLADAIEAGEHLKEPKA